MGKMGEMASIEEKMFVFGRYLSTHNVFINLQMQTATFYDLHHLQACCYRIGSVGRLACLCKCIATLSKQKKNVRTAHMLRYVCHFPKLWYCRYAVFHFPILPFFHFSHFFSIFHFPCQSSVFDLADCRKNLAGTPALLCVCSV